MAIAASRKETAIWLLERMVPGTGVNNVAAAFEVTGRLDRSVLAEALRVVVARHDTLRTVFCARDAELTKQVRDPDEVQVSIVDIAATDAGLDADLTAFAGEPFPLDGNLLVRAGVRAGTETDVCCVVVHHLVFDAMSSTILLRELLAAYEAVAAGTTPELTRVAPVPERVPTERSVAYWRKNLDGLRPAESGLWCAKPPGAGVSLQAETVHHTLSAAARDVVRRFQRELRAPEAVVLLAAYYVLLAQHGAGSDVVVGTPVNVRDHRTATAIGYHVNLLPLRVALAPDSDFQAVVKATRTTFLEAMSHADVPLEHVSPELLGDASASWRNSFFRHLFNYLPGTVETPLTLAGAPVRPVMVENGYSRFDLEFFVTSRADETRIRAAFRVDVFDADDVLRLLERYDALLIELGDAVDRPVAALSRLGATDRARLRPVASPTAATPMLDAIHATVSTAPDRVAVTDDGTQATYGQLWSAALDARDVVTAAGARTVAVLAPRGAAMAAAWLGVWLAGARCVLLDPIQPIGDLATRLTDSNVDMVFAAPGVTVPGGVSLPTIGSAARGDAPSTVDPDGVAYLEYVPGATSPTAVTVPHRAVACAVAQLADRVTPGPAVTLWLSSAATHASLLELLLALSTGGRVVVAPDSARTDGNLLRTLLERHEVDLAQAPPAVWRQVSEHVGAALVGRTVLVGQEPLSRPLAAQLRAAAGVLHHGYTTPGVAGYVTLAGPADEKCGLPVAGAFVTAPGTPYELGVGVRGELCLTGETVATGYHNRPDLTEARFGEHPVYGRYYRTGDLARVLPDGRIEVFGPLDAQVTVAGHRVHLGDVEATLAAHPDVEAVAVVAVPDGGLVAFVESAKPDVAERLREHARATCVCVPEIVVRDRLPVTVTSTVDRNALVALALSRAEAADAAEAEPPDETTTALVAIFGELLDRQDLHADSNFFASGGHSLLGAQLVQRVKRRLGVRVQLADLFSNPTPRQLAVYLATAIDDVDDEDEDDDE